MTVAPYLQFLGVLAGSITCFAGLPRVLQILRDPKVASGESVTRNVCMVAGNAIWVVYGIFAAAPAIIWMCSLNVALNGIILAAALRSTKSASS